MQRSEAETPGFGTGNPRDQHRQTLVEPCLHRAVHLMAHPDLGMHLHVREFMRDDRAVQPSSAGDAKR